MVASLPRLNEGTYWCVREMVAQAGPSWFSKCSCNLVREAGSYVDTPSYSTDVPVGYFSPRAARQQGSLLLLVAFVPSRWCGGMKHKEAGTAGTLIGHPALHMKRLSLSWLP